MAEVRLENLVKEYRDGKRVVARAVKGIDLHVQDGEFMVLVGPSGCGKSTTLRMIAGLESITEGTLTIGDRVVNHLRPKDRGIAMVFQSYALYPHLNVFDNMSVSLKLAKTPKAEIQRRVDEAAAILGLETYLDRKPRQLSGGQRQRVAVGRAIVRQPDVFLFDEPLSNLDAKMRVQMRAEIIKLHQKLDTTMIYVTHDQTEAMTMGDRICVMRDGQILQVDRPMDLYRQPRNLFAAGFIGSPPMNFFHGTLLQEGASHRFREVGAEGFELDVSPIAPNEKRESVILGVRPEDIHEREGEEPHVIRAQVEMVEPMGAEAYLHLRTASSAFIARVQKFREYRVGEQIDVALDLEHARLFDQDSEWVLEAGSGG